MDHHIGPQDPPPRLLAQTLATAPTRDAAPATLPVIPSIERFDEDNRPGRPNFAAQVQLSQAGTRTEARASGEAEPARAVYDANSERREFLRGDDVPHVELTLDDALDVINPLQHIPVVSSLYRAVTGDQISGPARILGGSLFGGPAGLINSLVNAIVEETSGRDVGATAIAALFGDEPDGASGSGVQTATLAATDATSAPATSQQSAADPAIPDQVVDQDADIPAAPAVPGDLTGQAALAAFASDLHGLGQAAARAPAPKASATGPVPVIPVDRIPPAPPIAAPLIAAPLIAAPPIAAVTANAELARIDPAALAARWIDQQNPAGSLGVPAAPGSLAPAGANLANFDAARPKTPFANQMLEGLDKYRALSRERATPTPRLLDRTL